MHPTRTLEDDVRCLFGQIINTAVFDINTKPSTSSLESVNPSLYNKPYDDSESRLCILLRACLMFNIDNIRKNRPTESLSW